MFDIDMIRTFYAGYPGRVDAARKFLGRPLTYAEKVLYAHLFDLPATTAYVRGTDYANFRPDRVAMQDATAQMALLQFMIAGRSTAAVPSTVHCDHLIQADNGREADLPIAEEGNREVYGFLRSVANKYGLGFWKPGAGIIHQVVLENYAFPAGMMVGTDSHTPNAGGLGMIAVGVGGADAVDVMAGMPWELKMPKLIGVRLTGSLSGWSAPKDVILVLAGILTVKGGTNAIIEYFGEGTKSLSATGKATICNMGAEVGATTSTFPFDESMAQYLRATERAEVAELAQNVAAELAPDPEVLENPGRYYDRVIEINLSEVEPHLNGPFTPDAAHPISSFAQAVRENGWPDKLEVGLIGSCTNSSYEDLTKVASVAEQAVKMGLKPRAEFIINPGSERVLQTATRDGIFEKLAPLGAIIMTNACGPCIGQWKRHTDDNTRRNSIVTSFNRNFAKRADGNPNTHAFVASPQIVAAMAIAGDMCFNPLTDCLTNEQGEKVRFEAPEGTALPEGGMQVKDSGYIAPATDGSAISVQIDPASNRIQALAPFPAFDQANFQSMPLLIKVQGKCTTDHISMAGPWLRYRGHLDNISGNMLMGAHNAFTGETNAVRNAIDGSTAGVSETARAYKAAGLHSIVIAEENYGEGSSREHAAMEPRFLNVSAVITKSFARIHETNLKKQGMLALTFADKDDYLKIREDDRISIPGVAGIEPGIPLTVVLEHSDGTSESFQALHTYNALQIAWLKAGSALNYQRTSK